MEPGKQLGLRGVAVLHGDRGGEGSRDGDKMEALFLLSRQLFDNKHTLAVTVLFSGRCI